MRIALHAGLSGMILLASSALAAQEVTGALQGRVILADSTPAAGAQLTLTGTQMQGPRNRVAGPDGFFQFLAVPPGEYRMQVTRIGARPVLVDSIRVSLGRTTSLGTLTMEVLPVAMQGVRVVASRVSVDPVRTTAGGVLYAEDYANLPTDRDFKAIIPVLPQVNISYRGDAPNVAGSTGLENQYFIDGVNVGDVRTGDRATGLPYNFVRAVEVKTGGYEAQFGRALGAIVNAVTYAGTNDVEWSAFAFTQPSALALEPRPLPNVSPGDANAYDLGVRVSGPISRDRLWYSTALNPRRETLRRDVTGLGQYTDRVSTLLFASKLTWRASSLANVELSVFGDPTERDAATSSGSYSVLNVDPLLTRVRSGGTVASLRATFTPSDRLSIETSLGRQWDRFSSVAATDRGRDEERFIDDVAMVLGGGVGAQQVDHRGRTTLGLRGTWSVARHTVGLGVEYDDQRNASSGAFTGRGLIVRYDSSSYLTHFEGYEGTFHNRSPAAYLQDSWRVTDRLTLNGGLRWSGQYLVGASGRVAQRIPDEWQPRAGFSWHVGESEGQRVFGSYGRFYQLLPLNIAALWFVDYACHTVFYDSDPRVASAVPADSADCSSKESDYAKQIPGLEAENFDEYTLGYERMLGASARLTVRAMHRALRSSFQWGFDPDADPVWAFGTPGKGDFDFLPAPKRAYTALEVSTEGVAGALQYRASYVLSRTSGNYNGLFSSDGGYANPGQNNLFGTPNQAVNSSGDLPTDRRHVAKGSGSWTTSFGLVAGAFLAFETGTPINELSAGPPGMGQSFLVPRGTAGRTPSLWNLDLRLAWDVPRASGPQLRLLADLLHLGNPRRTTRVDETHYTTLDADGKPETVNPSYREPLSYQPPMAARVGLEVKW